eukprot:scaffold6552_cov126-Skeletonema_dohrnii-CCMP3373.AAC.1
MAAAMNRGGHRRHHHHSPLLLLMSLLPPSSFFFLLRRQVHHHASSSSSRSAFANAFNLHQDITLKQCHHPYNNNLFDFYRTNFHDRRNKKIVPSLPRNQNNDDANNNNNSHNDDDAIYTLTTHQGNTIMAACRLTKSKHDNQYTFLRYICVSREHRRHGLASRLLKDSLQEFNAGCCYCFASPELDSFYQKLGFVSSSSSSSSSSIVTPPKWMMNSFESMVNRNQHKKLTLYIQQHHSTPSSSSSATPITTSSSSSNQNNSNTQIVLLQHYSEQSKKTATGWLLNDTQYSENFGTPPKNDLVETRMKVTIWTWRGTNDIAMIDEQIMRLLKDDDRTVHLLWTGGTAAATANAIMTNRTNSEEKAKAAETFIIIDGTWQQARKIYRKVPVLWSLPRISFNGTNVPPSTYVLRGDYSGWRERFSSGTATNNGGGGSNGGNDLLCTAEVAAAVMDRCGDGDCANVIRRRLDVFQSTFSHNNNNNNNNDN